MDLTQLTPDEVVLVEAGPLRLSLTIVMTWLVMALLIGGAALVTRRLTTGPRPPRWQTLLEVVIETTRAQIEEVTGRDGTRYLPFVATLFLFIAVSNLLMVVPGYVPPTASLSTTAALALCVFVAVPLFGIRASGLRRYLAGYLRPNPLMLPFNVIGELSRTLALAVRLFGNAMSGAKIGAILLAVAPLVFPVLLNLLGLITGLVQAYIFAILALVYIASGVQTQNHPHPPVEGSPP